DSFGHVLDFFGGQRDLRDKAIRVLHNLSFIEDPTRLFRAVRFEQRLGFRIGRQTERLMHSAVQLKLVRRVGGVRVLNELKLILGEAQIIPALERLDQFGLLQIIDSRIRFHAEVKKRLMAAERAASWYDLLYTGRPCRRWLLFLLCLVDTLPAGAARRMTNWFSMPPEERKVVLEEVPQARKLLRTIRQRLRRESTPANSDIYRWFEPLQIEVILYLMARTEDDRLRQWISLYMTSLRQQRTLLNGHDLIQLGLSPGPEFQRILRELLDARLDRRVQTREEEMAFVQEKFLSA
ncbi:MAG: polya polymerase, partial [Pelovirga sp.]